MLKPRLKKLSINYKSEITIKPLNNKKQNKKSNSPKNPNQENSY